ncbi:GNAT family N-acetyltransferase [Fictibacillus phosphorivorans]|uniref:GNAT family N-acetyltransferase n=1 Tax=Fictibacillus phosphorivorans TaxID=1221500 RepID=UPI00203E638C|nr:GNAT family N-acetyltransferase [Fictibacillus phosphorivorans]MCM3775208.1 GNAT family N-acetyltransferase [Fictibacillus phosphorivorans]
MSEVIIRETRYEDSYELSLLMGELGYPTTPEEMTERLETLLPNEAYACFVACINDQVIGMIGLMKGLYFEKNGCYARITALVVSEEFRGNGIGKQLVRYGEEWAKEQGATAILLNSGKQRTDTHEFYRSLDYDDTGLRFIKVML